MLINPMLQKRGGGGLSNGVVLWENPNPTAAISNFVNIPLPDDVAKYTYLGFIARYSTTNQQESEIAIRKTDYTASCAFISYEPSTGHSITRGINYVPTGNYVEITQCYSIGASNRWDNRLIPVRFIGYY